MSWGPSPLRGHGAARGRGSRAATVFWGCRGQEPAERPSPLGFMTPRAPVLIDLTPEPVDVIIVLDPTYAMQILVAGAWVDVPTWEVLAHELCGHALPKATGTHVPKGAPVGGTPPDETFAVQMERDIAAEHGLPLRSLDYSEARGRP